MFLCHFMKGVRGNIREAFILDESRKKNKSRCIFTTSFKIKHFGKKKYAQEKEILRNFQYKKAHADSLRQFRNF